MPWSTKDVSQHNAGLTKAQKKQWIATANSVLAQCKQDKGKDCEGKAIRIANASIKESIAMDIAEKGAKLNKDNRSWIKQALEALGNLAKSMPEETDDEADTTEASTWSNTDIATSIQKALKTTAKYGYLLDIFPDESLAVYQNGWSDGRYFECSYSLDETGVATLGDPVEVNRKVSYVKVSAETPKPAMMSYESAEIDIDGDTVQLIEKAVNGDGITMLKLISPGTGSSGFYSEAVLKQAASAKIFHKGLHNLIDHPTPQEESARPEGSIEKLGSTLVEDATWRDSYVDKTGLDHGAGLYARAKVVPNFKEQLNVIAGDIGTSIRAKGRAHMGTVDGKQVPIIDAIEQARSVDYVTLPGRGGKVLELVESKREPSNMNEDEIKQLRETNQTLATQVARLLEGQALQQAQQIAATTLRSYPTLPLATRNRIAGTVAGMVVLNEHGALDTVKLEESLKGAIATETAYLTTIGVGNIADLGGVPANASTSIEAYEKQISENLAKI